MDVSTSKDVHILILGASEYVTSCGRGNLEDVIKLGTLKWGIILNYIGGPNVITGSL